MNLPVLMPEPNHLRFKRGYWKLGPADLVFIHPEVNRIYPGLISILNDTLGTQFTVDPDRNLCKLVFESSSDHEMKEESYSIRCEKDRTTISAKEQKGLFYAIQTLQQLIVKRSESEAVFKNVEIFDYPHVNQRGVHLYLPAQENIEYFKRFVKGLANMKYNRIYVEVSAMEYKRHPEINESWIQYAEDMDELPEKAKLYQNAFKYMKDSIHIENAGGNILSQETVKELVRFCKDHMFDVIPEVQSLSHCDYLVISHREIAERPYDPYPDTYCPMNPKSYELLFDVIDEVIDVFEPRVIHIGHDEWYTYCECEKCKEWDPADLFAYDVTKIHGYLAAKGIKTEMFGEKLLNAYTLDGRGQGGAFKVVESYEVSKIFSFRGAVFPAITKIPKDISLFQWYWGIEPTGFEQYRENGLTGVCGNFVGPNVPNWELYSRMDNVVGAECSHWDKLEENNMARDGFLFNLVYSSYALWNESYNNHSYEKVRDLTVAFSPYLLQILSGRIVPSFSKREYDTASVLVRHEQKEQYYLSTSAVEIRNFLHTNVKHEVGTYHSQIKRYTAAQSFRVGIVEDRADSIIFSHNTSAVIPFRLADHGYRIEDYLIGTYQVHYEDGSELPVELYFGQHIGNAHPDWGRKAESVCYNTTDIYFQQATYYVQPRLICDNDRGSQTVYDFEWSNPYPDKKITSISLSANNLSTPFKIMVYDIRCVQLKRGEQS